MGCDFWLGSGVRLLAAVHSRSSREMIHRAAAGSPLRDASCSRKDVEPSQIEHQHPVAGGKPPDAVGHKLARQRRGPPRSRIETALRRERLVATSYI
jgi:hypothetical protein